MYSFSAQSEYTIEQMTGHITTYYTNAHLLSTYCRILRWMYSTVQIEQVRLLSIAPPSVPFNRACIMSSFSNLALSQWVGLRLPHSKDNGSGSPLHLECSRLGMLLSMFSSLLNTIEKMQNAAMSRKEQLVVTSNIVSKHTKYMKIFVSHIKHPESLTEIYDGSRFIKIAYFDWRRQNGVLCLSWLPCIFRMSWHDGRWRAKETMHRRECLLQVNLRR